jgi:phage FluMu protein Com
MKTFCWGEKIPRNLFSQNPFDNGTIAAPTNSDSVTNKKCWRCKMVLKLKFIKCHPTERKSVAYKIRNLKNGKIQIQYS